MSEWGRMQNVLHDEFDRQGVTGVDVDAVIRAVVDVADLFPGLLRTEEAGLSEITMTEYPDGSVVRVEDMGPIERAYAEAMHDYCDEEPVGHPLAEHSPWSGSDLDGSEPWASFVARLARHGLALVALE